MGLRSFSEQSINDQEDDGADGGDENPAEVERLDLPETDEAAQKTADDRADDANEDRDKDPAWVLHNFFLLFLRNFTFSKVFRE